MIRDGFLAQTFHQLCDLKGPTITFITERNGGYLFGAYISHSWDTTYLCTTTEMDPSAFIFTLSNPHNIPPTKYFPKPNTGTHRSAAFLGPSFGDIRVFSNSNINRNSLVYFPYIYVDTTGKGQDTFFVSTVVNADASPFSTSEIEVYSVL